MNKLLKSPIIYYFRRFFLYFRDLVCYNMITLNYDNFMKG